MKLTDYNPTANPEYLDQVVDALIAEGSELAGVEVDREHIRKLLQPGTNIRCLVAVEAGQLYGTVILAISPLWYAPTVIVAKDLLVWVAPERRGGSTFVKMLHAIEIWAANNGIAKLYLSQSTGTEVDKTARLYAKLGYSIIGFLSSKRIR